MRVLKFLLFEQCQVGMTMRSTHFIESKMNAKPPAKPPAPFPKISPAPVFDPNAPKPKRPCSERQLQALKEGREKSSLYQTLRKVPKRKKTLKKR
jgi:hypothetical protein